MPILGIVINPVNKQLLIARKIPEGVGLYNINSVYMSEPMIGQARLTFPKKRYKDCYLHTEEDLVEQVSGLPRAHPEIKSEYQKLGFGSPLYSSAILAAIRSGKMNFNNAAICSHKRYRSEQADKWWNKAEIHNVSQKVTTQIVPCIQEDLDDLSYMTDKIIRKDIEMRGIKNYEYKISVKYPSTTVYDYEYDVLTLSAVIKAGWVGLITDEIKVNFLDEINHTNTILCNFNTLIEAKWKFVDNENKIIIFDRITRIAGNLFPQSELRKLEKTVFEK